jgi:ABC-type branched-subunit amino acid transport system substrate-binding protein
MACSSTTRLATGASSGSADGPGADASLEDATAAGDRTTEAAGETASAPRVGATTGARTGAAAASGPSGGQARVAGGGGAVEIGIQTIADVNTGRFGASSDSGDFGDQAAALAPVVRWINEHGGVAGRPVAPVFHQTDIETQSFAAGAQEACSDFTEDHHVFAAVAGFASDENLLSCLASKNVPLVAQNRGTYDRHTYAQFPRHLYQPGRMNATRWGAVVIDELAVQGFFRGATVGLIRFQDSVFERVTRDAVRPRLAAHNVTLKEEVAIRKPAGSTELGDVAAQVASALLRFRSSNVTHVVFVDFSGLLPFFFMPAAEGQGYRPMYGLSSIDLPGFLADNVPASQLVNSVGVGWVPYEDGPEESGIASPNARLCAELIPGGDEVASCEALLFLKAALDRAGEVSVAALQRGAEALAEFDSPATFRSMFAPGRHDGAAAVRHLHFDQGCGCFTYRGPVRSVG